MIENFDTHTHLWILTFTSTLFLSLSHILYTQFTIHNENQWQTYHSSHKIMRNKLLLNKTWNKITLLQPILHTHCVHNTQCCLISEKKCWPYFSNNLVGLVKFLKIMGFQKIFKILEKCNSIFQISTVESCMTDIAEMFQKKKNLERFDRMEKSTRSYLNNLDNFSHEF